MIMIVVASWLLYRYLVLQKRRLAKLIGVKKAAVYDKTAINLKAIKASQWLAVIATVIALTTFTVWCWGLNATLLFALILTITVYGASRASGSAGASGAGTHE